MTANTIAQAIATALQPLGHEVNISELKQGFSEDSFFINLVETQYTRMIRNKYTGLYSFDVIYFTLSKPDAYDMADQLMTILDNISTSDGNIKGSKMSYDYIDNALHFLVSYSVSLYKPVDADPIMETDTLIANTKGE
jgi:hypothetical protein